MMTTVLYDLNRDASAACCPEAPGYIKLSRLVSLPGQRSFGTEMFITMAITSTTASVRHDASSECVIDEVETITLYVVRALCQPE